VKQQVPKTGNQPSLERKDKTREVAKPEGKKGASSVVFNTLYSMRRGDNNHSSSLNNFQQVRKQDFQTAGKSTSKGP
jgi:hypothetical protein